MGVINDSSSSITAMYKFYHSDRSKFYPTAGSSHEMPDEVYCVTLAPDSANNTAAQSVIRLVRTTSGTWMTKALLDQTDTAAVGIMSGVQTGQFARMGNKMYYTNGESPVMQIRSRDSAQDSAAKILYEAGLPDPNAYRQFDECDTTGNVTYSVGDGAGSAEVSLSVQHRRQGTGALVMSQENPNATASLSLTTGSAHDWTSFSDGTTASGSDFFAMNLYRFDKSAISEVRIDIYCNSAANYFTSYCAVSGSVTNPDGSNWENWSPVQNIAQAKWATNPYDNQMFPIRIRRDYFGGTGSPDWEKVETIKISMKSQSKASSTRPAKIAVDDIKFLKSPPVPTTNRIQMATFEHSENNSTLGWLKDTAALTKADFNYTFAREGAACIGVAEGATAKLKFTSPQDFGTFPDGTTADTSCVIRCNLTWSPMGYQVGFTWAGTFTAPTVKFIDNVGDWRAVTMFSMGNLQGGGLVKQALWTDGNEGAWTGTATMDWENVVEIDVSGPADSALSPEPFYFDDLRIERPYDAQQPVYIFEPIERYAIDIATEVIGAQFKDLAWMADMAGEAVKWIFGNLKYQTYGMGWMTYPDYEHSSIGIAGCTLNSYGSKPFGCRFRFNDTHDLSTYKIPVINYPPSWTNFPEELGPIKWVDIPAGSDDKFQIWLAVHPEKWTNIDRIHIRIHSDNSGNVDQENYMEYSISGPELQKIGKEQKNLKQWKREIEGIAMALDEGRDQEKTSQIGVALLGQSQDTQVLKELVTSSFKYLGVDRGGWSSGTFEWKRSDMITVENSQSGRAFNMAQVRGISIELVATGGSAVVCVDNFMMKKEGAMDGEYRYSILLEDREGNLSPSSEYSSVAKVTNSDVVLSNIYVPTGPNKLRCANKRVYRIGGMSGQMRYVGNCAVSNDKYYDSLDDSNVGQLVPEDAYAPPRSKIIKAINNTMYYGNITKDRVGERWPYRIMASEPFVPFRVSDFKAMDIPEDKGGGLVAIEGYYGQVIMWTPDSMWSAPEGLTTVPVRRNGKGCIARDSVALSDYGLIWLSRDGIVLGDISRVDDNFFKPINPLFESFTEEELADAKGFILGQYYYLFYNFNGTNGTGDGICCYLPERTFSELTGPFDMRSFCRWDGGPDANDIYYGRSSGEIYKLFSGDTDNGTAITTTLRTRDFSHPGIQYEKWLRAYYLSIANIGAVDSTVTPKVYINETPVETMPIWTATSTTVKTMVQPSQQGSRGTHISMALSGTGTYKITEMIIKVELEDDVEYKL